MAGEWENIYSKLSYYKIGGDNMSNYKLSVSDYRYAKEKPVLIGTMAVTVLLIVLMFMLYLPLGIGFLVSIGLLLLNLHSAQLTMIGASVRVSENQFPHIYKMAKLAAERLDIELPPVYIRQSPIINAFATGFFGHYYIVLHSATIEACSDEELLMIIGHEFAHIKGNHVMLNALMNMGVGNGMKLFPGLSWLQTIIQFVFLYLSRCFEYTCDRGGLIANGDVKAVITAQTKLAVGKELFKSINIMEFYKQALELDKVPFGFMAEMEATHPLTVNRIRQAVRFYRSDAYRKIAAMQGKSGTSTLKGSLATGDLMQRILDKPEKNQPQAKTHKQNGSTSQKTGSTSQNRNYQIDKNVQSNAETCKNCGTKRKGEALFCVTCGSKFSSQKVSLNTVPVSLQEEDFVPVIAVEEIESTQTPVSEHKFCNQCGSKNQPKAVFCTECGNKF